MEDRLYTAREVATNTPWNPKGLGLLPFDYIYVKQRVKEDKLGFSDYKKTAGGHDKYKFSLKDIEEYNNKYGRKNEKDKS